MSDGWVDGARRGRAGMRDSAVALSGHARARSTQRGIPPAAIDQACAYGRLIQTAGAQFYFMGRREIAAACACGEARRAMERCHGLVVLLSGCGSVITV